MVPERRFLVGLLWGVLAGTSAQANQMVIGASKDNTLIERTDGSSSNGAGSRFFVGRVGFNDSFPIRRGLVAFDIAGNIPAGSTIDSVVLRLNMSRARTSIARTISLHRITEDWGEGTSSTSQGSGVLSTTNDATWIHTFFNTGFWATSGGDFSGTISDDASVTGLGPYTWGSTAQMVTDVQTWLDTPGTNFGWLLQGDEITSRSVKAFDTRENITVTNRPMRLPVISFNRRKTPFTGLP